VKSVIVAMLLLVAVGAQAQDEWLTVVGDLNDATVNTIQVDPRPVAVSGQQRTMKLRVNRMAARVSREGIPYTSYEALVVFDCAERTGRYTQVVYFMQPFWKGESHKTSIYTRADPRFLTFVNVVPNPAARIVRAACPGPGGVRVD
jgi:hypothetical protein